MAWWSRSAPAPVPVYIDVPAVRRQLTAAATLRGPGDKLLVQTDVWQNEVWGYYDDLGEFRFAVDWHANAMSRVRLRAAKIRPGQDEPEIVDAGPAADLMSALMDDVAGRATFMKSCTQLLDVPGEAYLTGETIGGVTRWAVRSADQIRASNAGANRSRVEVVDVDASQASREVWRDLAAERLIVRVWRPHARYAQLADSPARAARPTMRELELINRKIQAQYLSRLASAGLVIFPDEVAFPVREEFEDAPDPFMSEWIETAREAIANPGTAASVIPIPMRVPGEFVDKIKFIDFTMRIDEQEIQRRDSVIRRLATQLDLPAEVLLGMGEVNHWSAWALDEAAIKIHISPTAELICQALTTGYLRPSLEAAGGKFNPAEWVVWYDTSELALRPDKSANALQAYDRVELTGAALRRELGFDEDDAPENDDELGTQILKKLLANGQLAADAANELVPNLIEPPPPPVPPGGVPGEVDTGAPAASGTDGATQDETGPPKTQGQPPPASAGKTGPPRQAQTTVRRWVTPADVAGHTLELAFDGSWHVLHNTCRYRTGDETGVCPVNVAANLHPDIAPGTPGSYRLGANAGKIVVGERLHTVSDVDPVRVR